jgi:hypothetical protein
MIEQGKAAGPAMFVVRALVATEFEIGEARLTTV